MSKDRTDRIAVNREPRGSASGHQDENVTGHPVQVDDDRPLKLNEQVRHIEFDAAHLSKDEGGLSTAFGKYPESSVAAYKRGTSGPSNLSDDGHGVRRQDLWESARLGVTES